MQEDTNDFVNIRIKRNTRDTLVAIGKKSQTYDDIIVALINYWNESGDIQDPVSIDTIKKALRK